MFVISLSSKKVMKIALAFSLVFTLSCAVALILYHCKKSNTTNDNLLVNNTASNIEEILAFVSNFGWSVKNEPDEIREIIIPVEFDEVYKKYNEIQISQGYDLSDYSGERVKNWTFTVLNYPGYEGEECIKINILVQNGKVIGGDVCSIKLDGFMHGFAKD